ncbi:hypothetical protein GSZ80_003675 [Salmonella enterica]|nr:hypothetical protein [Salmonella enterica]
MPECAHRLMRCRPSLVRGRAAQVNPGGFTTPARRPSVPALLQIVGGDKLIIPFC